MRMIPKKYEGRLLVGWCEWCSLSELKIPAIKAKVDTGAATSALHAFDIEPYMKEGRDYVRFKVHPIQGNSHLSIKCRAPIIDIRSVRSSNGHEEQRYVIATSLTLGGESWDIELTLSNRDPLRFRMLLGREAMKHNTIILPDRRLHQGKVTKKQLRRLFA